jgi:hypothetical protein
MEKEVFETILWPNRRFYAEGEFEVTRIVCGLFAEKALKLQRKTVRNSVKKSVAVLMSLIVFLLIGACGKLDDPSAEPLAALTPIQRARFERTLDSVAEVTKWRQSVASPPASLRTPPPNAPKTPQLVGSRAQLSSADKVQVMKQIDERCRFDVENPPPATPTPSPAPPPTPASVPTSTFKAKIESKEKGAAKCPVTFIWDYSIERTFDKAAVLTDMKVDEKLHYSPLSDEIKGAFNVQRYDHLVNFTLGKKGDAEKVTGSGRGTLIHILDGTLQTVVFSMRALGNKDLNNSKYSVSYFFVYGDGMRVEVKMESVKIGSGTLQQTFTLNGDTISQLEFATYLKKFGVPENLPENLPKPVTEPVTEPETRPK